MKENEKNRIIAMRSEGRSLSDIADTLGISRNTVKSFCRRNGLTGTDEPAERTCQCCGKPMTVCPGHREKRFCSDRCRQRAWNRSLGETQLAGMREYACPACGKPFYAYPGRQRKYCSRTCYFETRFGGAVCG